MPLDARALRVYVYDHILGHGLPPTSRDIAKHFNEPQTQVLRTLGDMKIGKTILPHPQTGEIWMAGPFASAPTEYQVIGRTTQWWANCAWDMLGVAVLVGGQMHIETRCVDCGTPMRLDVDPAREALQDSAVVHFLVPARHWYDDIGFT